MSLLDTGGQSFTLTLVHRDNNAAETEDSDHQQDLNGHH